MSTASYFGTGALQDYSLQSRQLQHNLGTGAMQDYNWQLAYSQSRCIISWYRCNARRQLTVYITLAAGSLDASKHTVDSS